MTALRALIFATILLIGSGAWAADDAATLLSDGIELVSTGEHEPAAAVFDEAIRAAQQAGDVATLTRAQLNAGRLAWHRQQAEAARSYVKASLATNSALPDSQDRVFLLLSASQAMLLEPDTPRARPWDRELAYRALTVAQRVASEIDDDRGLSYAQGYLAQLYLTDEKYSESLELLDKAVFLAQEIDAPELLYQWFWARGRALTALSQLGDATTAYRQAVFHLGEVRAALEAETVAGTSTFRSVLGPLYLEYADILLRLAAADPDVDTSQPLLLEVMATIEQLKTAELQDYFLDECVVLAQSRATGVQAVAPDTAVIYPVLLSDRIELLLSIGDKTRRFAVPVDAQALDKETKRFRIALENSRSKRYLRPAKQLYDWLIHPLEKTLQESGVKTLVFVPDGPLRTIPLAALHDGESFVIEHYALATTPGLTLTDARPLSSNAKVLISGLSVAAHGFQPIPAVETELDTLAGLLGADNVTILRNEEFTGERVGIELAAQSYNIVHIASHGQFTSDVRDSFILAHDGKITMDRLEGYMQLGRFSDEPVELLTLSACETARGDDRAALGMSGIAIKAGARSALGSLWLISDAATEQLIGKFYSGLVTPGATRAGALRDAQLKLLQGSQFEHPRFWSPFLLIGSWL